MSRGRRKKEIVSTSFDDWVFVNEDYPQLIVGEMFTSVDVRVKFFGGKTKDNCYYDYRQNVWLDEFADEISTQVVAWQSL